MNSFRILCNLLLGRIVDDWKFLMRLIRLVRWHLAKRAGKRFVTTQTQQGSYRVFTFDDFVSKPLFVEKSFEYQEIQRVMEWVESIGRIQSESVFIDVGANIGVIGITVLLERKARTAICIEPEPNNVELLQHNVILNGINEQVTIVAVAASETDGQADFELSEDNSGDHRIRVAGVDKGAGGLIGEHMRSVVSVPLQTLNHIVSEHLEDNLQNVSICWADTQGHEMQLLRGGQLLWNAGIPAYIEFCPYMLMRSGESRRSVLETICNSFSCFGVFRKGRFVFYCAERIVEFWDEVGETMGFENILLVPEGMNVTIVGESN